MHSFLVRETEVEETSHIAHLLEYDREFYWRWMRRAVAFISHRDQNQGADTRAIRHIKDKYCLIVERLLSLRKTVIHGEFFASNVLIHKNDGQMRVYPVDWEMAAIGPGLVDLAGLTSGNWSVAEKEAMALAYFGALALTVQKTQTWETFSMDLECCRLHQAIQWLGWSAEWTPPPEHAQNWLQEALRCCDSIT
jgi:aminoglycoside/choline kinase family phosphotransferase